MAENKNNNEDKAVENNTTALSVQSSNTLSTSTDESVEVLKDFLDLAKEDLEVRKQEALTKTKEIDNAHEYAMKALGFQAEDNTQIRKELKDRRRDYLIVGGIVFLLIGAFLIYCLQTGKEEIAMKIVTYGGTALVSGVSGYFIGQGKKKSSADNTE